MPSRLRPTASLAADAILVGDPGRALMLAQELLEQPRMSNHARGLWGYSGRTEAGAGLTIQATGMGGPSAAIVLADLAKLGVGRAVRVGTCTALGERAEPGALLLVTEAVAGGGSAAAFGLAAGESARPGEDLVKGLAARLGEAAQAATVASLDVPPGAEQAPGEALAADMQTVAVLARGRQLGVETAALLIVSEAGGERLDDEAVEAAAKRAGNAAAAVLST